MTDKDSVLGISGFVTRERADELVSVLTEAWTAVFAQAPGDLSNDLALARRWFDPVAQGQRLRREIASLDPLPDSLVDPQPPLTVSVGPGRWLVTPEGRCALDLLQHLPAQERGHFIGDDQVAPYERRLAILYREWSRHRLNSVVDLLSGSTKPLQIPAAGIVVALLVNRSTAEERALVRYTSDPERRVIDQAFFGSVQAFANVLAPKRRRSGLSAQLISGWMLYEVRRRVGSDMVLLDARGGHNGAVWIKVEGIENVIDTVSRDLVRGHRARATVERFAEAFDELVDHLRRDSSALAGYGLAHERPRETRRIRESFAARIAHYLSEDA